MTLAAVRVPLHLGVYQLGEPVEVTRQRVDLHFVMSDLRRGKGFRTASARKDRYHAPTRLERLAAIAYT